MNYAFVSPRQFGLILHCSVFSAILCILAHVLVSQRSSLLLWLHWHLTTVVSGVLGFWACPSGRQHWCI